MTPYRKSVNAFKRFARSVRIPDTITMFFYERKDIRNGSQWKWDIVYDRVHAANRLGWDCVIRANDDGMTIEYRRKPDFSEVP